MIPPVLPDADALVVGLVRDASAASAFTEIPADAVDRLPFNLVYVLPGPGPVHSLALDRATVEVQSWAANRPTAWQLAQDVQGGLYALWFNQQPRAEGLLSSYRCAASPRRLRVPDDPDGVVRYRALYELTLRSTP